MRTKFAVLVAMVAMMALGLSAGFTLADDVAVDIRDSGNSSSTATGGISTASSSVGNVINTNGNANDNAAIIDNPREFLAAPGFGQFLNSGNPLESGKWQVYCPPVYRKLSAKEISSMKRKFQASDIFPWNWNERIRSVKIGESLPNNTNDTICVDYWPKSIAYSSDRVLATARIVGDPNWPEEAFLGMAESACKELSGSSRVAMQARTLKDGVTIGRSIGLGGAGAKVSGDEGTVFAVGGQLGNNRTRVEDHVEFEILCLNDGPFRLPAGLSTLVAEKPRVDNDSKPVPQAVAKPVCDPEPFKNQIKELEKKVADCKRFCLDNLKLRSQLGDAYINLAVCTGDNTHFNSAIKQYEIAERNYHQGHDISANRAEADKVIAQVYYNWAGCIRELNGREAAVSFAQDKDLERIPTGFAR